MLGSSSITEMAKQTRSRTKLLGKYPKLCRRTGLRRKLLQLPLSPHPKCKNPTTMTKDVTSPSGTLPYNTQTAEATFFRGYPCSGQRPFLTLFSSKPWSQPCAFDCRAKVQATQGAGNLSSHF